MKAKSIFIKCFKSFSLKEKKLGDKTEVNVDNPYLNARCEWNERYGDFVTAAKTWRMTAIISLSITFTAVIGLFYMGSQNHLVPYVVEVDKLGAAIVVSRADKVRTPDQRIIRSQLARFISDVRNVYVDAGAERVMADESYAMINRNAAGYQELTEFFRHNDPFERAKKETVNVAVQSVLPISPDTWRVEWREETRGRDGQLLRVEEWQAALTVTVSPPINEQNLFSNPMGVYVDSIDWAKRL